MGYVNAQLFLNAYTPSDTILASNDAQQSTAVTVYTKLKEIKLVQPTYSDGRFRFVFDLKQNNNHAPGSYATIYKNGVAIGTERNESAGNWATFTEDINIGSWTVGDTIELWAHTQALHAVYVRNFRIEGAGSPFINTLGM